MTALSTVFIAPCSLKLRFYVNVRVTVAVKTKTHRHAAPRFFKTPPPSSAVNGRWVFASLQKAYVSFESQLLLKSEKNPVNLEMEPG